MTKYSILLIFVFLIGVISCNESIIEPGKNYHFIPELVLIDQNLTFTMGNSWNDPVEQNEIPAHTVQLSPYYIGKYEVTNEEYSYFVKDSGYTDSIYWSNDGWKLIKELSLIRPIHWDRSDTPWKNYKYSNQAQMPICNITWWEAEAYCRWLSKNTGSYYTLPTEAQWERAARGPDPGRKFPWGNINDFSKYNDVGFFSSTRNMKIVGSYSSGKSYDGCYDMSGNANEYCKDWYDSFKNSYYQLCYEHGTISNPQGPVDGRSKVIRGVPNMLSANDKEAREMTSTRRFGAILYTTDGNIYKSIDNDCSFRIVKKYQ